MFVCLLLVVLAESAEHLLRSARPIRASQYLATEFHIYAGFALSSAYWDFYSDLLLHIGSLPFSQTK